MRICRCAKALVVAEMLLLQGQGCSSVTINATPPNPATESASATSATQGFSTRARVADSGNFVVKYEGAQKLKEAAKAVEDAEALSGLLPSLNANFALEKDLPTVFRECDGKVNAFYDPNKQEVTICYEFIQYLAEGFTQVYEKDHEADEALTNAITFFFFHELGHALVHLDQLPAVGGQEEAADQFATFVLLDLGDDGPRTAVHAAVAFARIVGEGDSLEDGTVGDEHPLGKQRAFNLLCWVYGSDPKASGMKAAVSGAGLPETRMAGCAEEYSAMRNAWLELLSPHLKQDAEASQSAEATGGQPR